VTDTENECFPDPEGMDGEQRLELIEALHSDNHDLLDKVRELADVIASGANAMVIIAGELDEADAKGKRRKALILASAKLETIGRMTLAYLGITPEDIEEQSAFADIVSSLEDDPTFNQEGEEDAEH
jgi:hypothetical protein